MNGEYFAIDLASQSDDEALSLLHSNLRLDRWWTLFGTDGRKLRDTNEVDQYLVDHHGEYDSVSHITVQRIQKFVETRVEVATAGEKHFENRIRHFELLLATTNRWIQFWQEPKATSLRKYAEEEGYDKENFQKRTLCERNNYEKVIKTMNDQQSAQRKFTCLMKFLKTTLEPKLEELKTREQKMNRLTDEAGDTDTGLKDTSGSKSPYMLRGNT